MLFTEERTSAISTANSKLSVIFHFDVNIRICCISCPFNSSYEIIIYIIQWFELALIETCLLHKYTIYYLDLFTLVLSRII